jgi:hypothetical protein
MKRLTFGFINNDVLVEFLLSRGMNLEYYDHVMFSKAYLEKVFKTKSCDFGYSGLTATLSNGNKKTILFIWEEEYDLPAATLKMKEILMNLDENMLEEMNKRSLKQTLKRIRKTNINVN